MEREPSRAPCALDGRRQSLLRIGMAPDQAWPLSKRAARQAHEFDSAGSPFFLWNLLLPFGLSRELQGRRTSMTLSLKSFRLVDSSSSNWDRSSSSWSLLGPSFGPGSTAIALDQSRSRPKGAARQAHEFDSARSPFCRGTSSSSSRCWVPVLDPALLRSLSTSLGLCQGSYEAGAWVLTQP